ncbi:MAG: prepilin-type N-terminal cleavage/methylation domain-containing protein, partial [Planctomycetota bacterium]
MSGCDGVSGSRGLTLLEVLVAIAVLAVLIGISLPALHGAKVAAAQSQSVANA